MGITYNIVKYLGYTNYFCFYNKKIDVANTENQY